jgi:serine/threonine protein kinase
VQAACSIGKIIQLVGLFPWDCDSNYTEEFELAKLLLKKGPIKSRPLEAELSSMEVPNDCVDFILHLRALDPYERPTAEQALKHPWLRDAA